MLVSFKKQIPLRQSENQNISYWNKMKIKPQTEILEPENNFDHHYGLFPKSSN